MKVPSVNLLFVLRGHLLFTANISMNTAKNFFGKKLIFPFLQVDEEQMNTILSYIESGKKEGAKLTVGGTR